MTLIYKDDGTVYSLAVARLMWRYSDERARESFSDYIADVLNEISCNKNDMIHACLTRAECGRVAMRIRDKNRSQTAREGARNDGEGGTRGGASPREGASEGASAREGQGANLRHEGARKGAREGANTYEGARGREGAQGRDGATACAKVDLFHDFSTTAKA